MPVIIQKGDMTITVEGEDANRLLQHVEKLLASDVRQQGQGVQTTSKTPEDRAELDRFKRLYRSLGEKPRLVLATLFKDTEGMTDVQLRETLAAQGIKTLAGSMTAIVKGAKRVGIELGHVLEKERFRDRETGGFFVYRLGRITRDYLTELEAKNKETADSAKK
jgi:hypothetical protein